MRLLQDILKDAENATTISELCDLLLEITKDFNYYPIKAIDKLIYKICDIAKDIMLYSRDDPGSYDVW